MLAIAPVARAQAQAGKNLAAVACSGPTACTAVGNHMSLGGTSGTLAARWNGVSWRQQGTPNPTGAVYSLLNGAACPSSSACIAIGYSVNAAGAQTSLAERWDGSRWQLQTTPNPIGATEIVLNAVSCVSSTDCWAVGDYLDSALGETVFAEHWNGIVWTLEALPNPRSGNRQLLGVSCASATACVAVGYDDGGAMAERWNGTSWQVHTAPNSSLDGFLLNGVSCTSANTCTAVGEGVGSAPLAQRWDGGTWSTQKMPKAPGGNNDLVNGVSCSSATACIAVGFTTTFLSQTMFAENWDGTSWRVQSIPGPAGAGDTNLWGVSCSSPTACTAVGSYPNSSGILVPLAERWDGTSWQVQSIP